MGVPGDMGQAIHDFARQNGYTVVKEIGGHGVGLNFMRTHGSVMYQGGHGNAYGTGHDIYH